MAALIGTALALDAPRAQGTALPTQEVVSVSAQAEWNAVGRVNIAGYKSRRMCSGVLVAPDKVLTAAHCVMKRGTIAPAAEVVFGAGWRGGETAADSIGARIIVHPDFLHRSPSAGIAVGSDVALIDLAEPLPIAPLPLSPHATDGVAAQAPLEIVGYRADRPHIATRHSNCRAVDWRPVSFATNCEVTQGTSGAPVLATGAEGRRVVGIISAARPGGSLAAAPFDWVAELARRTPD
ncbi:MAG: trypsin-like peptidase domain-containing protein [Pseudomonadota bacterium]